MDLIRAKNKETVYTFPFCFLLVEFVLGMYLNDIFIDYLTYADEALAVILLAWTLKYAIAQKKEPFDKETKIFAGIALFYLIYSFYIRSNVPAGILGDFIIQLKPFIAFYMMAYIGFVLNDSQKLILKKVCLLLFFITASFGVVSLMPGSSKLLFIVFQHPTRYGTDLVLIGLTYLFCSDLRKKKDLVYFVVILTFSVISMKAKILGFYGVALFLVLVLRGDIEIKVSVKNVIIACCIIAIASYLAWNKLSFYFLDYTPESEDSLARPMLYLTAWELMFDYFPFGSGLASFATSYSGVFYSHIYGDYNLDVIWGLIEGDAAFAADTQYPSIAQYGVAGLILFIIFWTRIIIRANRLKKETGDITSFLIVVLLLLFLIIESVADAVFTGNRGFYAMLLLSLSFNQLSKYQEHEEINNANQDC